MAEKTIRYEYTPRNGRVPGAFDRVEVGCPHCDAHFWLEADGRGHVSDGDHCCSTGSWLIVDPP